MTKQEFISRQKAMTQSSNKRAIGWVVMFFAVLFGGITAARYGESHEEFAWMIPVFGIGLLVFLLGNILLLTWFFKREQRQFGVLCPSCGKPLVNVSAQIAIATGSCGHCGERVFSETNNG